MASENKRYYVEYHLYSCSNTPSLQSDGAAAVACSTQISQVYDCLIRLRSASWVGELIDDVKLEAMMYHSMDT